MITKLFLGCAIAILLSSYHLPLNAKEEPVTKIESSLETSQEEIHNANRWSETLRLRDFHLSPTFLELRSDLKTYRDTLFKNYQEHPDVFSTAVEYGLVLIDLGELDKAEIVWERALKDFRSNQVPKVYKAWVDACQGDYLGAKNTWYPIAKEKLDLGFNNIMWFTHQVDAILGLYLIKDSLPPKDKEEVESVISEIAKQMGPHPKLSTILITNDLKAGKLKEAEERTTRIIKLHPEEAIFITLLGIKNLLDGKYEEALKFFDKANLMNPNLPTNHLMRARTLAALKRKKESLTEIEQAMRLDPSWKLNKQKKNVLLAAKSYLLPIEKQTKKSKAGTKLPTIKQEEKVKESALPNVPENL